MTYLVGKQGRRERISPFVKDASPDLPYISELLLKHQTILETGLIVKYSSACIVGALSLRLCPPPYVYAVVCTSFLCYKKTTGNSLCVLQCVNSAEQTPPFKPIIIYTVIRNIMHLNIQFFKGKKIKSGREISTNKPFLTKIFSVEQCIFDVCSGWGGGIDLLRSKTTPGQYSTRATQHRYTEVIGYMINS